MLRRKYTCNQTLQLIQVQGKVKKKLDSFDYPQGTVHYPTRDYT